MRLRRCWRASGGEKLKAKRGLRVLIGALAELEDGRELVVIFGDRLEGRISKYAGYQLVDPNHPEEGVVQARLIDIKRVVDENAYSDVRTRARLLITALGANCEAVSEDVEEAECAGREADALADGSLSEFTCASCGYTAHREHPCLYLDPEKMICIYHVVDEDMADAASGLFSDLSERGSGFEGCRFRIVPSRADLEDKLAILNAGLDDRAIELLKVGLIGQAKMSGYVPAGSECIAYFVGLDANGLHFRIIVGDDSFMTSIDTGAYEMFGTMLAESGIAQDQPFSVGYSWACAAMDELR